MGGIGGCLGDALWGKKGLVGVMGSRDKVTFPGAEMSWGSGIRVGGDARGKGLAGPWELGLKGLAKGGG